MHWTKWEVVFVNLEHAIYLTCKTEEKKCGHYSNDSHTSVIFTQAYQLSSSLYTVNLKQGFNNTCHA
jgi:hypothetical protein